jgi:hypothetical protein
MQVLPGCPLKPALAQPNRPEFRPAAAWIAVSPAGDRANFRQDESTRNMRFVFDGIMCEYTPEARDMAKQIFARDILIFTKVLAYDIICYDNTNKRWKKVNPGSASSDKNYRG